jgi:hypothetical protein
MLSHKTLSCCPKPGRPGPRVVPYFFFFSKNSFSGKNSELWFVATIANRKTGWAGATLVEFLHEIFHDSVFERVKRNYAKMSSWI